MLILSTHNIIRLRRINVVVPHMLFIWKIASILWTRSEYRVRNSLTTNISAIRTLNRIAKLQLSTSSMSLHSWALYVQ